MAYDRVVSMTGFGRYKTERHPFSIVNSLIETSRELLHSMFVSSCSRLIATGLVIGTGFVRILVYSKRKITTSLCVIHWLAAAGHEEKLFCRRWMSGVRELRVKMVSVIIPRPWLTGRIFAAGPPWSDVERWTVVEVRLNPRSQAKYAKSMKNKLQRRL